MLRRYLKKQNKVLLILPSFWSTSGVFLPVLSLFCYTQQYNRHLRPGRRDKARRQSRTRLSEQKLPLLPCFIHLPFQFHGVTTER